MNGTANIDLRTIQQRLATYRPQTLPVDRGHAAVTMLLRERALRPELLFIVRAPHDGDPWSGDIGFPGGRLEADEKHPRQAAERETKEELGIDLGQSDYLGRLDDIYGATLPILVSCFVFKLNADQHLQPNHEIAEIFWFNLMQLLEVKRHHMANFNYRGQQITHPAVDLLGPGQTVLWGITYRLVRSFFAIFDRPFGHGEVAVDARP
jgi:8-oxo-dGTP pyrophosphatase MutT (NUDIX family)